MTASVITGNLTGSVTEDVTLKATGLFSVSPADTSASFVARTVEGKYGTLTVTASGDWQYILDNAFGEVQSLSADTTVHDEFVIFWGNVLSAVVDIEIHGNNDLASFEGDINRTLNINVADHISGQVLVSDIDAEEKIIQATNSMLGAVGTFSITSDGVWRYDLLPGKQISLIDEKKSLLETFQVVSKDGSRVDVSIQIAGADVRPTKSITGTNGADSLSGGSGNDTLDGGDGLDTAIFIGPRNNYLVTSGATGWSVSSVADGLDTLVNFERIKFSNMAMAIDLEGVGGQAYRIYQAAFARTPDSGGLGYWISVMDRGANLRDVAAGFVASDEYKAMYGVNPRNADLIDKYYRNILGRAPEKAGADYWTSVLDGKSDTVAGVLSNISESSENKVGLILIIGNGFEYTPFG